MTTATQELTNDQRSALEVAAFKTEEPGPYFAYYKAASGFPNPQRLVRGDKITTWMGDTLATLTWAGERHRCIFGDERQNFRALGLNGVTYAGTAYVTTGDYVRMRPVKSS